MNHTLEFEIIDKDYEEGECYDFKMDLKQTEDDDFIIQRHLSQSSYYEYVDYKNFIDPHSLNFLFITYKNNQHYLISVALTEFEKNLTLQNRGTVPEELITNVHVRDSIVRRIKEKARILEEQRMEILKASQGNQYRPCSDNIYYEGHSHSILTPGSYISSDITLGSNGTVALTNGTNATATIHVDPSQYSKLLSSISNVNTVSAGSLSTNGSIGTIYSTNVVVDDRKHQRAFMSPGNKQDYIFNRMLSLLNKTEITKIIQGALQNNHLYRAIINKASDLNLANWVGESK